MTKFRMTCAAASFCFLSLSANATTAVLCGDPALVDENNDNADVWLILMNSDSQVPEEVDVTYLGKEAKTVAVKSKGGILTVQTSKPIRVVRLNEANIDSSVCDGERLFSVDVESAEATENFGNCRCFED